MLDRTNAENVIQLLERYVIQGAFFFAERGPCSFGDEKISRKQKTFKPAKMARRRDWPNLMKVSP
jgi:hypothetical protein